MGEKKKYALEIIIYQLLYYIPFPYDFYMQSIQLHFLPEPPPPTSKASKVILI